jgi:hypothetical protein
MLDGLLGDASRADVSSMKVFRTNAVALRYASRVDDGRGTHKAPPA